MNETVPFEEVEQRLLQDPEVRKAYDTLGPAYEVERNRIRRELQQFMAQPCCPVCQCVVMSMSSESAGVKKVRCGKCGHKFEVEGNDVRHNMPVAGREKVE